MDKKKLIEKEIEETLKGFKRAERLKPNPYFFTRLQARIEERDHANEKRLTIFKPVFLGFILALNILTVILLLKPNETGSTKRETRLQSFGREFNLGASQSNPLISK